MIKRKIASVIVSIPNIIGIIIITPIILFFAIILLPFTLYESLKNYAETGHWEFKWLE